MDALKRIAAKLPGDLPAAVLMVLHVWPEGPSLLPQILNSAGELTAVHPYDGEALEYGRIYVAPPDVHLTVAASVVRLVRGPKENRHRPAVDPLFRTAAALYGPRVVACVLTGTMDDGTAGALAVRRHGGAIIVQDPADALHDGMPASVINNVPVDHVLPLEAIPAKLIELVGNGLPASTAAPFEITDADLAEARITDLDMDAIENVDRRGKPSVFACPECNGILWEVEDEGLLRFRCRVGHAYTASSLSVEQSERLEDALWTAFRSLEETAGLHRRIADRARARGHVRVASEHEAAAETQDESARVLRELILKPRPAVEWPEKEHAES
ncbi:MAG: chemotaxis protein CheB [Bryobacteraceae bacterium]|nr:chemotaxis protein CheB [Bryobacteraceae bacterium]